MSPDLLGGCRRKSHSVTNFKVEKSDPRAGEAPQILQDLTEEQAIIYYFHRGFQYNDILRFLSEFHEVHIFHRTLLNRLHDYGLKRSLRVVNEEVHGNQVKKQVHGNQVKDQT